MTNPSVPENYEIDMQAPNFAAELSYLGTTGAATYAPHGTALPIGMQPYADPCVNVGWLNDEGLGEAMNEESNAFTPWQSDGPIRTSISSREFNFNLTLWSLGGIANALYYGVPEEEMSYFEPEGYVQFDQGGKLPKDYKFMMSFDVLDGVKHRRFILPAATVAERGDTTYTKGDLTGYPLTIKATYDRAAGFSVRRRFKEGWKPGAAGTLLSGTIPTPSLGEWHHDVNAPVGGDTPVPEQPVEDTTGETQTP